jgi:outer membrane protein assembly factor BamB
MRVAVIFCLTSLLLACGITPKDYSNAAKLQPVKTQLDVKLQWIVPTGDVPDYASAQLTPVVKGGNVFIADISGKISMLDAVNGKTIWSHTIANSITSNPGVGNDLVYIGTRNANFIALDRKNGTERWRTQLSSVTLATPLVLKDSVIVQTIDGKVASLNANTGKLNWTYSNPVPKLTLRGTASPIKVGDAIIVGFAAGSLVSLDVNNGEINWTATITTPRGRTDLERLADIDGLFQAFDNTVYVCSYQGRVAAVSVADGNIQWSRKMSSYRGLSIGNGQIYISDVADNVWALDARTGATLWRQGKLSGREISAPVAVGKDVVVADFDGYIHWMSGEDGRFIARQSMKELWQDTYHPVFDTVEDERLDMETHRSVTVPPVVANNILYIRDNTGSLAAFKAVVNSK